MCVHVSRWIFLAMSCVWTCRVYVSVVYQLIIPIPLLSFNFSFALLSHFCYQCTMAFIIYEFHNTPQHKSVAISSLPCVWPAAFAINLTRHALSPQPPLRESSQSKTGRQCLRKRDERERPPWALALLSRMPLEYAGFVFADLIVLTS